MPNRLLYAIFAVLLATYAPWIHAVDWQTLSAGQKQALLPLADNWHKLPDDQQQQLLKTAESYHLLNADQQKRFHKRLTVWINLTPEQRNAARDKYRAFSQVPSEMQEEVKQLLKHQQP